MPRSAWFARLLLGLVFLGLVGWLPPVAALPDPLPEPVYATGHVLVKLATEDPVAAGLPPRAQHLFDGWYRVPVAPGGNVAGAVTDWRGRPGVVAVYPDLMLQLPDEPAVPVALAPPAFSPPDDPLYIRQWHMPQIGVEAAWAITTGVDADSGEGVVVAVVDTGVATGGPDGFCLPLFAEYNAINHTTGSGVANDGNGHGTHVAGTIAGCANNGIGVVGVAPSARLMAVKVLSDAGTGPFSTVAEGIVWATDHGARVLNLSLGSPCGSGWPTCSVAIVNDAIAHAAAADAVIVISAGNDDRPYVGQPGNHPEAIAVAATEFRRELASYSNYGAALSLAAPGGDKNADRNGDGFPDGVLQETRRPTWDYYYLAGTSMAAPHVAGTAALLRACVPEADRDAVRAALEDYALDLGAPGFDTTFGHGFLQADAALAGLAYAFGRDPAAACAPTGQPPPCFTIAATADGPGTAAVDPSPNCDPDGVDPVDLTAYTFGTRLTLSAAPDAGNLFTGWSGDATGTTNPLPLRITRDLSVTATFAPPPPEPLVAVSLKANGSAAGLAYADEDVVLDDPAAGLSLLFDGSAFGLAAADIDGLARLADGTLLISTDAPVRNLPGIGGTAVDDSDIVRFDPATGLYSWYFDGSDVGLTTAAEDVDALALLPDGRLLVSTSGKFAVPGLTAADEDVLAFTGVLGSAATSGSWALYLDGSDLGSVGDIDGLAVGGTGTIYLSAEAVVTLRGQTMAPADIFTCIPTSLGATTQCAISRFWQGTANGFAATANVDAVEVFLP